MILVLAAALCAALHALLIPPGAGARLHAAGMAGTEVTVAVTGLRSAKGVVRACLTRDSRAFPKCESEQDYRLVAPASPNPTFTFSDVMPGRYAIALLHDENRNGKIDRALFLMPKEGFGFSRDAPVRMGPPKFEAAAFTVEHEPVHQTIHMRYML